MSGRCVRGEGRLLGRGACGGIPGGEVLVGGFLGLSLERFGGMEEAESGQEWRKGMIRGLVGHGILLGRGR